MDQSSKILKRNNVLRKLAHNTYEYFAPKFCAIYLVSAFTLVLILILKIFI